MAFKFYTSAMRRMASGDIDLNTDDIRVLLLMSNTTADSEDSGIETVSNFTVLDHFDGTGYTPASAIALTSEAVASDTANRRAEFDAADISGLTLGNGTRQIAGLLFIKFVTDIASSYPIAWDDGLRKVVCAETALSAATSIRVDPLPYSLASGSTITFGTVIATLTSAAAAGDRTVSVSALSAGVAEDTEGDATVVATAAFPVDGNSFTGVTFSSEGVFHFQNIVR